MNYYEQYRPVVEPYVQPKEEPLSALDHVAIGALDFVDWVREKMRGARSEEIILASRPAGNSSESENEALDGLIAIEEEFGDLVHRMPIDLISHYFPGPDGGYDLLAWTRRSPYPGEPQKLNLIPPQLADYDYSDYFQAEHVAYMHFPLGAQEDDEKKLFMYPVGESPATLFIADAQQSTNFLTSVASGFNWADCYPNGRSHLGATTVIVARPERLPSFSKIGQLPTAGDMSLDKPGPVYLDSRDIESLMDVIVQERRNPWKSNVRRHRTIFIDDIGSLSGENVPLLYSLLTAPQDAYTHFIATIQPADYLNARIPVPIDYFPYIFLGSLAAAEKQGLRLPDDPLWNQAADLPPWHFIVPTQDETGRIIGKNYWMLKP